jgi:hypothetical protein
MSAPSKKNQAGSTASLIKLLTAMAERMSHRVGAALDDGTPAPQHQACPISTAVEFGLAVPHPRGDGSKKIFC